jgi:MFS family permease
MASVEREHRPEIGRRSVFALLACVLFSSAASMAQTTILGKQVYDLTHHPLDLGLLGLAEFAPAALLVLVTGSVADRFDRRRVTAMAMLGEAVVAVGLALYAASEPTSVGPIFLLTIAFGIARAFVAPSLRSLPADMVSADRLSWLVPRFSAAWQAAVVIGPVMGGFLYTVTVWAPYAACAVLLGLGALMILGVTITQHAPAEVVDGAEAPTGGAMLHEAMEGLRFIRNQPVLLGAISLDLFAVLFGGAIALLPAIAEDRLGVGAIGLGWLRAAGGIGAAAVTVWLAVRPFAHKVGRTLLTAVAVFGVGTVVLAVTRDFVIAFVALAVLSGADAISVYIRATLVPLITPRDKRGRVLAVENVFIGASNELGAFESGVVAQLLNAAAAVLLGGIATLGVAFAWWFLFPALRAVDTFPDSADDPRRDQARSEP